MRSLHAIDMSTPTNEEKSEGSLRDRALKGGLPPRKGKAKHTERKAPASNRGFGRTTGLKYTREPKLDGLCACGSSMTYGECCASSHEAGAVTSDALTLLRARYSAFQYRLPDFLMATTQPGSEEWQDDATAWKKGLLAFCDRFVFEGLNVDHISPSPDPDAAQITFTVSLVEKGSIKMLASRETSRFVRTDGMWLYVSGDVEYCNPT